MGKFITSVRDHLILDALPPSLPACHGVIGRDLLRHWEYFRYEGRRQRLTIRDTPNPLLRWWTG